jgi:hypothetical protein
MATVDSLPADQRAALSLLLQQGRSYEQIANVLSIDRVAVRGRALAAIAALADHVSAALAASESANLLTEAERAELSDYLLGQVSPEEAERMRAQLAHSPVQRRWARAAAWELASLSTAPLESLPRAPRTKPGSRRRGASLLALVAAIVVAIVLIALLSSSGSKRSAASAQRSSTTTSKTATPGKTATSGKTTTGARQSSTAARTRTSATSSSAKLGIVAQLNLLSQQRAYASAVGVAQIVRTGASTGLMLVAQRMPANPANEYYAVWLSNTASDSLFLGFLPKRLTATGDLNADAVLQTSDSRYSKLLVTLETPTHSTVPGTVVLEGPFKLPS